MRTNVVRGYDRNINAGVLSFDKNEIKSAESMDSMRFNSFEYSARAILRVSAAKTFDTSYVLNKSPIFSRLCPT